MDGELKEGHTNETYELSLLQVILLEQVSLTVTDLER